MDYLQEPIADGILVWMRGSFTFKDHSRFREVLNILTASTGGRKLIDLSGVDFLDSAALGMLLIAEDETAGSQGRLTLRNPSSQISRLFELAAMDTVFRIERTTDAGSARQR